MEESWRSIQVSGWEAFVIKEKLKDLKGKLKAWNKDIFGDLNTKRKAIVKELNNLDKKAEDSPLIFEDVSKKKELNSGYWRISNLNESLLFQKARISWTKEGETNTKLFHGMINWRIRNNSLLGLNLEDRWSEIPLEVKAETKKLFTQKFIENHCTSPTLEGVPFRQLSMEDYNDLIAPFVVEEIKEARWECDGDKSPNQMVIISGSLSRFGIYFKMIL